MAIELFDLSSGPDDVRFSPFCWRARLALAHKGQTVRTIPVKFNEKHKLAFSGQELVPVLRDGDTVVSDSWKIADYLEERYPDQPELFGGTIGRATARFCDLWTETFHQPLAHIFALDVWDLLDAADKDYYRTTREMLHGETLEETQRNRNEHRAEFRRTLAPLRDLLEEQSFVAGASPAYVDYIVFGYFQGARCISTFELLEDNDPVAAWRGRMLDLFDGLAANAPRVR